MATSVATSGFGTLLAAGDGGVGLGVQASKTIGATNQLLKVSARYAGTAGNSKTFGIIVAGVSTAYSQVITATSVLINSATDGASAATTTVAGAMSSLNASGTFADNFIASTTGNGSGVLLAGASGVLSGGTNGTEVFTNIAEIKSLSGPTPTVAFAEVTHMESPGAVREFLPTLTDPGELSVVCNFLPDNVTHDAMRTDMFAKTKRNFTLTMTDTAPATVWSFSGYYSQLNLATPLDGPAELTVGIKLTSTIVET